MSFPIIARSKYLKKSDRHLLASKDRLEVKSNIVIHLRIGDILTSVLITIVWNAVIHAMLVIAFIDAHILAIIPDEKSSCLNVDSSRHYKTAQYIWKCSITGKIRRTRTKRLLIEQKTTKRLTIRHLNTIRVVKQNFLEPLSVTLMMVTAKAMRLPHLDTDPSCVTRGYLPAKGIVEGLAKSPIFILVTNTFVRKQWFNKHEVLWSMNDD